MVQKRLPQESARSMYESMTQFWAVSKPADSEQQQMSPSEGTPLPAKVQIRNLLLTRRIDGQYCQVDAKG